MRNRLMLTFACIALAAASITLAQDPIEPGDLESRIAETIERYGKGKLERAWQGAAILEGFGEGAIPSLRRLLVEGSVHHKLMASKALIALGATEKVAKTLRGIAAETELVEAQRVAALRLLVNFPGSETKKLLVALLEGEGAYDATLRIHAAKTLFQTARDRTARSSLMPLLEVDDAEVRAEAALALGEMGYVQGRCRSIIQDLSTEPTPRGTQARLIIQSERLMQRLLAEGAVSSDSDQNRYIEQLERDLEKKTKENEELRRNFRRDENHLLISALLDAIKANYADPDRFDKQDLLVAAAKGMVASLDPFSSFMDPKDTGDFDEGISGAYAGIGAQVAKDRADRTLLILRPVYKGPAYRLGLRSGDKITEVEGTDTAGLQLTDITKKLKGPPGTSVSMMVFRRGWKEPREFTITRETIRLESVHSRLLPGDIGYLHLAQFGDTAVEEFTSAVDELEALGMKGLIVDLRLNPGGYLNAAVAIVDEFVGEDKRPVVTQKGGSPTFKPTARYTTAHKRDDYPLVVLVNRASASASEIVSGALQDFGRATVVGERTFGKGSVQRLLSMPTAIDEDLGGRTTLRLTVQYYYLPSGRSIHAKRDERGKVIEEGGVIPDVEVEPERTPLWRLEAVGKLIEAKAFDEYLDVHFERNNDAFRKIAEVGDEGRTEVYPDFESFFAGRNKSMAQNDDIRYELRRKIRRRVEDDRGKEFACNYPEDAQLQRAILVMLDKLDRKAAELAEYAWFADKFAEAPK